jgi:hypothetical protein
MPTRIISPNHRTPNMEPEYEVRLQLNPRKVLDHENKLKQCVLNLIGRPPPSPPSYSSPPDWLIVCVLSTTSGRDKRIKTFFNRFVDRPYTRVLPPPRVRASRSPVCYGINRDESSYLSVLYEQESIAEEQKELRIIWRGKQEQEPHDCKPRTTTWRIL